VCLKQAISVIAEDYMYISFYENRVLATFLALHCMSNLETGGFLKEEIDSQSESAVDFWRLFCVGVLQDHSEAQ
jgi:hypothetical protein